MPPRSAGTRPPSAPRDAAWVLGTTGLSPDDRAALARAALTVAVVQAANFSPGVNLLLGIAEQLGAALPANAYDAEILETHHRQKLDAPSGTALAIGEAVAAGRGTNLAGTRIPVRDGMSGIRQEGGIGFASLRGGQIVGEHSLVLTADDEQIVLTHRAFDRAASRAAPCARPCGLPASRPACMECSTCWA